MGIKKITNTIAAQLMSSIFRIYLIMAIVITGAQLYFEFIGVKKNVVNEIVDIKESMVPALANAFWNEDIESIKWIIEGIKTNNVVMGVKLFNEFGEITHDIGETNEKEVGEGKNTRLRNFWNELIRLDFQIEYIEGEKVTKLGKGVFFSGHDMVIQRVQYGFILLIVNALIKTSLLWLIMFLFVRKILISPVNNLTDQIQDIQIQNLKPIKLPLDSKNELTILKDAFNNMINELILSQKTKRNFIMNMGHELKTPLNSIMGFTEVLERSQLDKNQREYLKAIKTSSLALLELIKNILTLSKGLEGSLEHDSKEIEILYVINNLEGTFRPIIEKKGIRFDLSIQDDFPKTITMDQNKFASILNHLMENAYKFTSHGRIILSLEFKETKKDHANLTFRVTDTGRGIPEEERDKVFEPFYQIDVDTTYEFGGTGIGLSLVKKLVENAKGKIELNSEVGKGSEFIIHFKNVMVSGKLATSTGSLGNQDTFEIQKETRLVIEETGLRNKRRKVAIERVDLSDENKEKLIKLLSEKYLPLVISLQETLTINEIEKFSEEIIGVGKKFEFIPLISWGETLHNETLNFHMDELPITLGEFRFIIEDLGYKTDDQGKAS